MILDSLFIGVSPLRLFFFGYVSETSHDMIQPIRLRRGCTLTTGKSRRGEHRNSNVMRIILRTRDAGSAVSQGFPRVHGDKHQRITKLLESNILIRAPSGLSRALEQFPKAGITALADQPVCSDSARLIAYLTGYNPASTAKRIASAFVATPSDLSMAARCILTVRSLKLSS
jgi:hypothetical protein